MTSRTSSSRMWQRRSQASLESRALIKARSSTPVSLVLVWLATIGIHLNTPRLELEKRNLAAPTLPEVRMVMEWLFAEKDAV